MERERERERSIAIIIIIIIIKVQYIGNWRSPNLQIPKK
jgi:hypothetical protein